MVLNIYNDTLRISIDMTNYGTQSIATSNALFNDNKWHLLCSVKNGGSFSLYIDGILQKTVIDNATFSSTENYLIGHHTFWPNNGLNTYTGLMDDIRIYSRALSGAEILTLYHEGGWTGN
jgi:hypothetical protein